MARLNSITSDSRWDKTEYVVTRDDGSCYKCFTDYEAARTYYQYLQQLDNQEKMIAQNQQIINNQNSLLDYQKKNNQNIPRFIPSKPIHDPEYDEWLRYKKATDPKYQEWKREEARKKREIERTQEEENRIWREQNEKQEIKKSLPQFKHQLKQLTDGLDAYIKWVPIVRKVLSFGLDAVNYLHNAGDYRCAYSRNSYSVELINDDFLRYEEKYSFFLDQLKSLKKSIEELSACCEKNDLKTMRIHYSSCSSALAEYNELMREYNNIRRGVYYVYEYLYIIKTNFINANDWRRFGLFGPEGKIRRACKYYLERYHDLFIIMKQHGVAIFDGCEIIYGGSNNCLFQKVCYDYRDKETGDKNRFFNYNNVITSL